VTLSTGGAAGKGIAVDPTRVFWVDQDSSGNGSVYSVPKNVAGAAAMMLAKNQAAPLDVALDATGLYWSVTSSALPGCLAMSLKAMSASPSCVVGGAYATVRMTLGGGDIVLLASQGNGNPFLGTAAKAGGGTYQPVQAQGPGVAMTATSADIFVANRLHVDVYALQGLTMGASLCMTNCGNGGETIVDMVLDVGATNVLWATSGGNIYSAMIGQTQSSGTFLGTVPATPQRIARDAYYVYVTTAAAESGAVLAIPFATGPTIVLAQNEPAPFGVAVDDTNVYWTNAAGQVRAVGAPHP
jgi:hypothetical protein